jgi:hypothetical protein
MTENTPQFSAQGISWGQTVLFQSLIVQLIESRVLPVDQAERVFDIALERAKKGRDQVPDAERYVQHVHDDLQWDHFYRWAAQRRKDP